MKLEDFVSETLSQLIKGVKKAQDSAGKHGAVINPRSVSTGSQEAVLDSSTNALIEKVEFEVALTRTEEEQAKGGIGVFFADIGIGAKGQLDTSKASLNRIRFSIPVVLPVSR